LVSVNLIFESNIKYWVKGLSMKNMHELIEGFIKSTSKTMRAKYESKKKLPDLDKFKSEFIQDARILANNFKPDGKEKERLMEAFDLTAKRIQEGTEPKLETLIKNEYDDLKEKKSSNIP
jgi:hypothetical protein